jgi:hypothetical protein
MVKIFKKIIGMEQESNFEKWLMKQFHLTMEVSLMKILQQEVTTVMWVETEIELDQVQQIFKHI